MSVTLNVLLEIDIVSLIWLNAFKPLPNLDSRIDGGDKYLSVTVFPSEALYFGVMAKQVNKNH